MFHSFANRAILVLTFLQCFQLSYQMGMNYTHRLYIDNDGSYHLSWKFDDKEIEFEVIANTTGYVGFGFSRDGTMEHSDVVIGQVKNGQSSLKDYHGFANGTLVDDAVQNWMMVSADQLNNQTKLIFKRELITNDKNDMDITGDTMRVIWAYSDEEFNKDNFTVGGYKSLYLLQRQRPDITIPDNAVTLKVTVNQTLVPDETTTYWCKRIQVPVYKEKMHVIKLSPLITKGNEMIVHHMILYHCKTMNPVMEGEKGHWCYAENMPENWERCSSLIYGWAIGGSNFPMPKHVGLPIGGTSEESIFILEIHYDNPERKSGVLDSSGFEMILVPATRDFDAGILEIGQVIFKHDKPTVQNIPPYQETFRYQSVCRSNCIYDVFPPQNKSVVIKMFAMVLHAHLLARQIVLYHYRNGQQIATISADRNYDFNYQETIFLNKEIEFLPGDDLKVECVYNSMSKRKFTWGGLATTDEMCLVFILYYPKVNTVSCLSGITIEDTTWLENSVNPENVVQFKKPEISEEFEKTVNGLGRTSSFETYCSDGIKRTRETESSVNVLNILQFNSVSSKAGISSLNVFGLSLRSVFLAAVMLYLMIQ